mmetsp:Transcript_16545/g.29142  ORF Transcript_16545/g.29142 Transcript_16545/m.29142 type:complete len:183 (-) Transcript_16545:184-732(-)
MLVFINPKCVKYQEAHPGSNILTCYFCIIFDNQINYGRRFITGTDRTPPTNLDATHIDDGMGESHMRRSVDSQNIIFDSCIASPSNANEIAEEEAGGSLAEEGEDAPPTRLNHTQEVNADPPPTTRASYPIAVSLWKGESQVSTEIAEASHSERDFDDPRCSDDESSHDSSYSHFLAFLFGV